MVVYLSSTIRGLRIRACVVALSQPLEDLGEVGRNRWLGDVVVSGYLARGVAELARGELGRRCLGDQRRHRLAERVRGDPFVTGVLADLPPPPLDVDDLMPRGVAGREDGVVLVGSRELPALDGWPDGRPPGCGCGELPTICNRAGDSGIHHRPARGQSGAPTRVANPIAPLRSRSSDGPRGRESMALPTRTGVPGVPSRKEAPARRLPTTCPLMADEGTP